MMRIPIRKHRPGACEVAHERQWAEIGPERYEVWYLRRQDGKFYRNTSLRSRRQAKKRAREIRDLGFEVFIVDLKGYWL